MEINKKVAIVTGGVGGIGFATVQHLLKNGAKYVAIFDVLKPDVNAVTHDLKKLGSEFEERKYGYYECDVTDSAKFADLFKKIMKEQAYVDILVNNAGIGNPGNIGLMIDVNFKSVVTCTMTALNYMVESKGGRGGIIVNNSSVFGLITGPEAPLYCATKHAVVAFVRSMKAHNEILKVRIVCICPGYTKTNMIKLENQETYKMEFVDPNLVEQYITSHPYIQEPDNVAVAIVEIIKRGEPGAVWVAQNDDPPFAEEYHEDSRLRN